MICERVQLAIVEGAELDGELRSHLASCKECGFLAELSRNLTDVGRTEPSDAGPLGPGFAAVLAAAIGTGEPLLGRYRLEALRGRGGQGEVYRAKDLETDETVALKLVRATGDANEVANARRVRHHNVCRVYHTERFGDVRLIVMEYVDGPTLQEQLASLDRAKALAVFRGVCSGVAAAHHAGILHLDLKPGNILLRDGEAVVTDFGLSRRLEAAATASGGTPKYMAPEQHRGGPVDRRTDVYALGRILAEIDRPDRRPPRHWRRLARKASASDPEDRLADAGVLLRTLDPKRRRWPRVVLAVLGAGIVALLVLFLVLTPPTGPRAEWSARLWGNDAVPTDAWNVARNLDASGLPQVEIEGPMFGCGQQPWELLDGLAQYGTWEHGVAWPPVEYVYRPESGGAPVVKRHQCDLLSELGHCGTVPDDAQLCERTGSQWGEFRLLDLRARDLRLVPDEMRPRIGHAIPRDPCGERGLVVHLDGVHAVFAVRAWHHGVEHAPRHYRVEDATGKVLFETFNNGAARKEEEHLALGPTGGGGSAPTTAIFAPVTTDRIRFVLDVCSTLSEEELLVYNDRHAHPERVVKHPGHGWLYEIEVFARLPRHEAWRRHLFD